jgi:hypothetical protein
VFRVGAAPHVYMYKCTPAVASAATSTSEEVSEACARRTALSMRDGCCDARSANCSGRSRAAAKRNRRRMLRRASAAEHAASRRRRLRSAHTHRAADHATATGTGRSASRGRPAAAATVEARSRSRNGRGATSAKRRR